MPPSSLPARTQAPPESTWNIAGIFPTDEAWEAELVQLGVRLQALQRFQGRLGESPARLLEGFNLLETQLDRDFQIAVLEKAMNNFHRYFFIMPTLARFELEIHERIERGEALTAESLNILMANLFREGYGDEVTMDEARVGSTWMHFSTHMYLNFYVYQYATGISAAHALAEGVLAGQPGAAANYLAFLKAGSSLYPLDAPRLAGVDMTTPEPVEKAFGILSQMVDRLEQLVA